MNELPITMHKTIVSLLATLPTFSFAADLGPTKVDAGKINVRENQTYRLDGELSYLLNSSRANGSSTSKENLAARILFQRQAGIWGQELKAEAVSAHDDSDATKNVERYMIYGKLLHRNPDSSESVYQFLKLQADKDLRSSFDYQLGLTAGAGLDVFKTDKQELVAELGAGYRFSKVEDHHQYKRSDYNEFIGTTALFYQYRFNEAVSFHQGLSYEYGAKAQTFRSRSSVNASLTQSISGLVSYQIKDLKADGGDSRDTLLSVGLHYRH